MSIREMRSIANNMDDYVKDIERKKKERERKINPPRREMSRASSSAFSRALHTPANASKASLLFTGGIINPGKSGKPNQPALRRLSTVKSS